MEPTTAYNNNESPQGVARGLLGRLRAAADKQSSTNPDGDTFPPAPASIKEETPPETPEEEETADLWPRRLPEYVIENPVRDLWNEEIDDSANILGNFWLERGSFAVIQGTSGIGKSMVAFQIGVEAALGVPPFGFKVDKPLKVLLLQAEDSRNDRIRQASCISKLAETREERALVERNLRIVTPRKRAHRGAKLFDLLTRAFADFEFDLFILNPAFAFVDGSINDSTSVGDFLRTQLQEFLRAKNAGGIVVHHNPKPPKSGSGRAPDTTMYSGHGSAEWANAPRASITIERTRSPYVFQFSIGKRGSLSGWPVDRDGYYVRYFVHSRISDLYWAPATDADVVAATTGLSSDDFAAMFGGEGDMTFERIRAKCRGIGYNYSDEELSAILEEFVTQGRLITVEVDGERVWKPVKVAKNPKKAAAQNAVDAKHMEEVYALVKEAGSAGINNNRLRDRVSFGSSTLGKALERLVELGRIRKDKRRAYVATEAGLAVIGPR
jgi:AAA domain